MGEDQIGAERHAFPAHRDIQPDTLTPMREPAFLVEFAVIGQVALGHRPQQPAATHHQRAIVDPAVAPQRSPDHQHGRDGAAGIEYLRQVILDCIEQRGLQVQIVECVGRQAQLGIEQQVDMLRARLLRLLDNALRIIGDIGGADLRGAGRDAHEAVRMQVVKALR